MDNNNMEHSGHEDPTMMHGKTCNCPHHKTVPVLVILIGLAFLLAEVNVLTWGFVDVTWPILLILLGIAKLMGNSCKCGAK